MKPERLLVILMTLTLVLFVGCGRQSRPTDNGKLQKTEGQDQRNFTLTGEILTARALQSSESPASGKFIALSAVFVMMVVLMNQFYHLTILMTSN